LRYISDLHTFAHHWAFSVSDMLVHTSRARTHTSSAHRIKLLIVQSYCGARLGTTIGAGLGTSIGAGLVVDGTSAAGGAEATV
jgi:hypothetical protein